MAEMGHVWTAPVVQGKHFSEAFGCGHVFGLFHLEDYLFRDAAAMAAGPDVIRVSGPKQSHALKFVEVREWISPAPALPDLVLDAQPPAQPHSGVAVDRPIRFGDGAYFEVVRPPRSVRFNLPTSFVVSCDVPVSDCQCMDFINHALDALLRWPVSQARLAGSR